MSEMEKTKRLVIAALNASRLGEIEKMKLLNSITTDINNGFEEVKPGEIEKVEYWLVCYQIDGFWGVENVVLKDEHPIHYITRKSNDNKKICNLVNFWEIDHEQYVELGRYYDS
jgi:hypothetical protein